MTKYVIFSKNSARVFAGLHKVYTRRDLKEKSKKAAKSGALVQDESVDIHAIYH
jgi:hypothetical protein